MSNHSSEARDKSKEEEEGNVIKKTHSKFSVDAAIE